ncbi:unnamed protein product [Pleuronectes platessa]|uniref:FIP-RBD domain-containing protein n=1 Tax=Pleuronectes platessa TaxID=8262 RepID=A0A9N7W0A3_PLEPL|nr:unnamed protein product [Pleuronectes platessa]
MSYADKMTKDLQCGDRTGPHPVRPLTTAMLAEEKRTEGRSVLATGLEKLKSTIHPGRSSQVSEAETDRRKAQSLTEGAGSYYHLTHSELVALLGQREADLRRQGAEFERQRVLLAKRELELRRLKPQVRDLEDYIDTLLVRIMEQKPTLLQAPRDVEATSPGRLKVAGAVLKIHVVMDRLSSDASSALTEPDERGGELGLLHADWEAIVAYECSKVFLATSEDGVTQCHHSSSDLMLLPSARVVVIHTTPVCWYLTPTPSVSVCHIRFASGTHSAAAFRCL